MYITGNLKDHYHKMPNQQKLKAFKLNLKERGLLSIILEFANIPNWNLNLNQIAKEAGTSLSTIQKLIQKLIEKKWLFRQRVYSPNGLQGSYCKYELNLQPYNIQKSFDSEQNQNDKQEFAVKNVADSKSKPKNTEHNKNNSNKTDINPPYNEKVLDMRTEISDKINSYIWQNVDEYEEFFNLFILNKAKMMDKLPGEVQGIFRALEDRINTGKATMSDLTALKEWRQGYLKATTEISKKDLKKGFNNFVNEKKEVVNFDFMDDHLETEPDSIKKQPTSEQVEVEKANKIIDDLVEKAVKEGRIITRRINSWNVDGIQVDSWTFIELSEWLANELNQNKVV